MDIDREIANMQGETALPRKNGELIFSEPWEGRVFAMAIALHGGDVHHRAGVLRGGET